jgi:hypothetical protein
MLIRLSLLLLWYISAFQHFDSAFQVTHHHSLAAMRSFTKLLMCNGCTNATLLTNQESDGVGRINALTLTRTRSSCMLGSSCNKMWTKLLFQTDAF